MEGVAVAGGAGARLARSAWARWAAAATGVAVFALRPSTAVDPFTAPVLLAALYGSLWIVSVAPAVPPVPRRISPAAVLAAGLAAIAAVRLASPPVTPPDSRAVVLVLVVLAAVAEEAYFRRLLHGMLDRFGEAVAVGVVAVAFAVMHYPAYGAAAMPLDLGAGLVFGWQRWASGTWLVPAATHAAANLLSSV